MESYENGSRYACVTPSGLLSRLRREDGQASVWVAIILVAAAAYAVLTYLPPWYKSWKAKSVIGEVISGSSAEGASEEGFRESIVGALNKIQVDVGHGDVSVEINRESKKVSVVVQWKAQFNFPLTRKTTSMDFVIKTDYPLR